MRLALCLGLALLGLGSSSGSAAEPSARCAVRAIHALPDGEGIDPRITRLRPYLTKPPFTAWKRFALLEEKELSLPPGGRGTFTLPNGRPASLTFVEHLPAAAGRHRLRLRLELGEGDKRLLDTTFVLDEGGVVLQAGQKLGPGLLILGFSCETAA